MDAAESTAAAPPAAGVPVALFKKRAPKSNFRKRPATPPPASDSGSEYSSEDDAGHRVKRRRRAGVVTASSAASRARATDDLETTKYAADRSATIESSNDATKQSNWYDETASDALSARSLLGSTRPKPADGSPSTIAANDGTYKGASQYQSYIQKNPNAPSRQVGPVKAPTNLRTVTIVDLQPDVCKDYKQTGFCGFGDSCKFLHAREDYKQGWALERDWEIQTKGKRQAGTTVASANRAARLGDDGDEEDDALLERIPFACVICKQPYRSPVVTRCGHYFCEACALQRYRKNPACAACGASTNGVFNGAKTLQKLLEKKRQRLERKKEKAREEGQDVGDEQGVEQAEK